MVKTTSVDVWTYTRHTNMITVILYLHLSAVTTIDLVHNMVHTSELKNSSVFQCALLYMCPLNCVVNVYKFKRCSIISARSHDVFCSYNTRPIGYPYCCVWVSTGRPLSVSSFCFMWPLSDYLSFCFITFFVLLVNSAYVTVASAFGRHALHNSDHHVGLVLVE